MSPSESIAARVLVFGSCVARDAVAFADATSVDLRGYVARQSLISTGSDASAHLPRVLGIASRFQERMIRDDFAGSFFRRLEATAGQVDVLLWDLADERHGVHRFHDGSIVTRSIDTIRSEVVSRLLEDTEHMSFGSDEHFETWTEHVEQLDQRLMRLGLFDRTIVLEVPWALRTTEGKATPWSMGIRAADANRLYERYYDHLRRTGHRMVALPSESVLADPNHRWGLAPFHYTSDVYRTVLRQLRDMHGIPGLHSSET